MAREPAEDRPGRETPTAIYYQPDCRPGYSPDADPSHPDHPAHPADRPTVSVIVAGRDYARFLPDALASALNQSRPPIEVFYADDASSDGSPEVARSFPGVTVLPSPDGRHRGVADARNRAASRARGAWLLHLDADDILPSHYIESRLDAAARHPDAAFLYGPAQAFGAGRNHAWAVHDWTDDAPARLWECNWINTSSLVRADAFRSVGGWREGIGTAWDWDLWLRMARAGHRGAADRGATLLYRQHAGSVSVRDREADAGDGGPPFARNAWLQRAAAARTAIGCVLSDRILGLLPAWLDAIAATARHHAGAMGRERAYGAFGRVGPPPPSLHVLYTGDRARLPAVRAAIGRAESAAGWPIGESSLTHAPCRPAGSGEAARRDSVSEMLAAACNRLLRVADEEIVWFVEDDVIVPPNALHDLKRALLGRTPRPAVSGLYRSRHADPHLIAHDWDAGAGVARALCEPPTAERPVDLVGTGCLMVFRPLAGHPFRGHVGPIAAHDWRWCLDLAAAAVPDWRAGEDRRPVLVPSVKCRHHRTADDAVDVDMPVARAKRKMTIDELAALRRKPGGG